MLGPFILVLSILTIISLLNHVDGSNFITASNKRKMQNKEKFLLIQCSENDNCLVCKIWESYQ